MKLLTVLKLMLEKRGPDVYFSFSGQEGAVSGYININVENCQIISSHLNVRRNNLLKLNASSL